MSGVLPFPINSQLLLEVVDLHCTNLGGPFRLVRREGEPRRQPGKEEPRECFVVRVRLRR